MNFNLIKSRMFKPFAKHRFRCSHEGELVTLEFGDVPITMHYNDVFRIAQMMWVHAKTAKRKCGDDSIHITALGLASDKEAEYREKQMRREF